MAVPTDDLKNVRRSILSQRRWAFGACLALLIAAHEYEYVLLSTFPIHVQTKRSMSVLEAAISTPEPRVDILSIGSLTRVGHQDAQERTFGSRDIVRHYVRVTEQNDTEATCHSNLTDAHIQDVIDFCARPWTSRAEPAIRSDMRVIFGPTQSAGWLCAQKRPIDGLNALLRRYRNGLSIPAYVLIVDDDTYVNIDALLDLLRSSYPATMPVLRTSCVVDFLWDAKLKFPVGGFGSFLSRRSIERLIQPIECHNETMDMINGTDPFERFVCDQLRTNLLGEAVYFTNGMSVSDLLYAYTTQQAFGNVAGWTTDMGYCFHSDHALAYFFNYYHIGVPDEVLASADGSDTIEWPRDFGYELNR